MAQFDERTQALTDNPPYPGESNYLDRILSLLRSGPATESVVGATSSPAVPEVPGKSYVDERAANESRVAGLPVSDASRFVSDAGTNLQSLTRNPVDYVGGLIQPSQGGTLPPAQVAQAAPGFNAPSLAPDQIASGAPAQPAGASNPQAARAAAVVASATPANAAATLTPRASRATGSLPSPAGGPDLQGWGVSQDDNGIIRGEAPDEAQQKKAAQWAADHGYQHAITRVPGGPSLPGNDAEGDPVSQAVAKIDELSAQGAQVAANPGKKGKSLMEIFEESMKKIDSMPKTAEVSKADKDMLMLRFWMGVMAASSKPGAYLGGALGESGVSSIDQYEKLRKEAQDRTDKARTDAKDTAFKTAEVANKQEDNEKAARQLDILAAHYQNVDANAASEARTKAEALRKGHYLVTATPTGYAQTDQTSGKQGDFLRGPDGKILIPDSTSSESKDYQTAMRIMKDPDFASAWDRMKGHKTFDPQRAMEKNIVALQKQEELSTKKSSAEDLMRRAEEMTRVQIEAARKLGADKGGTLPPAGASQATGGKVYNTVDEMKADIAAKKIKSGDKIQTSSGPRVVP